MAVRVAWRHWWIIALAIGFFVVPLGFAMWVDSTQPREAPLPDGCMVVNFGSGKSKYARMVCLDESHPVPTEAR